MARDRTRARVRDRRGSAAAQRASSENRKATFKIVLVVAVVLLVGGIYFWAASSRRALDDQLCPTTPDSITVLLVDVTDPMNMAQRQDFENQLTKLKNSIPRYGKLIVAKVDATADRLLTPVITRCNPGTADDVSSATGDPSSVQKQWDQGFDAPLTAAFKGLNGATGADQSPILESIQSVALTELQKPGQEKLPKRLVVASDLLQNTADVSFYRGLPEPKDFTDGVVFRRIRTDLRGVEVELWMLERSDANTTQPRSLADLWERIIGAEGGDVRRIYNVSG
ncbi:hypothetical protein [Novosphingobium mangrovi (ex Hu et al. 2023)]|uniref:VWFA domain-containing protein n=1 Tax=Novosphingobium mangrovi (ex Hu et al. 2023) TaxID=2930094 RepID=A0ABT0A914_9SPHN|nr:hypothetical protein [Novosphingobium mangrovi (ex Hu et al. 2023)]MCJ1959651.1 hypothetical protein [Novosphingobium mangrovi (ex Hu et al. 2023)]